MELFNIVDMPKAKCASTLCFAKRFNTWKAMQTLLLPAGRSSVAPPAPPYREAVSGIVLCTSPRPSLRFNSTRDPHSPLSSLKSFNSLFSPYLNLNNQRVKPLSSSPIAAAYASPSDESEKAKLAQVSPCLSLFVLCFRIM